MKRAIFLMVCFMLAIIMHAQDDTTSPVSEVYESDVNFTAMMPTSSKLSKQQKTDLQNKVEKIIARNKAGMVSETNTFGIEADIAIKDSKTSMGLLRDVSVVVADVTLTAKNIEDGSVYYSNSIEIQADAIGKESEALGKLINSIKVTDPAFVRFIRTARKRIVEYYNARGLPLPIRKEIEPKVVHDTLTIENTVVVENTYVVDAPTQPAPTEDNTKPLCDVKVLTDAFDFKILSCEGDKSRDRITIKTEVYNRTGNTQMYRNFEQAFNDNGHQLKSLNGHGWEDYPLRVTLKRDFIITDVNYSETNVLTFLRFSIGGAGIEVRNLKVNWK